MTRFRPAVRLLTLTILAAATTVGVKAAEPDSAEVAAKVDRAIHEGLLEAGVGVAPPTNDEDFLRRVALDLAGRIPTPDQVLAFTASDDPAKRVKVVERLLDSDEYARNWSRYWRDVIFSRATNQRARLVQPRFEQWMTEQLRENTSWDLVATELLTANGDVRENGRVALMYAHDGDASEIAAETSRIFLGIQLSCANCHDHPYDPWKREQFHQLAAYFPRVRVRPVVEDGRPRSFEVISFDRAVGGNRGRSFDFAQAAPLLVRRYDKNGDRKLSQDEMQGSPLQRLADRLFDRLDTDGDELVSVEELQAYEPPVNIAERTRTEHLMPNLENPAQPGTRIDPAFFVSTEAAARELSDADRRLVLAQQITEPENVWFARAYVNRMWAELVGEGFYAPVDDMGPNRSASFPAALDALSDGFTDSGYDVKWLFRTITRTEAYQRSLRTPEPGQTLPFASAVPSRLRADQVYDSLVQALGVQELTAGRPGGDRMMAYRGVAGPRAQFTQLFGFDPSADKSDVIGDVPQALFLMNSDFVNRAIRTNAPTRLGTLLYQYQDNAKAVEQLYLITLARKPTEKELRICLDHVESREHRGEAYEDLMWSLLNSTEFVSRR